MLTRKAFAHLPTVIEHLPKLTKTLGGPDIYIKRDDQTGLALGGNKTRKLEYLLGQALAEGADLVLTTGAGQSNHCRQTAAAAARCGLDCILVLVKPVPKAPTANLFLDHLLGAEIIWTEKKNRDQMLEKAYTDAAEQGKKPYLIPYGGSNSVGAYAYFKAVEELQGQLPDKSPDWIVFASSSGGTQAGLVAGASYFHLDSKILGISVDEPEPILTDRVSVLANEISNLYGDKTQFSPDQILVNDNFIGDGYGVLNERDRKAIHLFADLEGILLDPVYTGRAGAGLIHLIRSGYFEKEDRVLFWHTGGTPALFAEQYMGDILSK
jgi:D-cysteine desulfhydrase family pyridoxal phosphate-dependent enzyme